MSELAGELPPTGVEYVMEDVVRLEFRLGRTTLVVMGPEDEINNARMLVEGVKDLWIQAIEAEQTKVEIDSGRAEVYGLIEDEVTDIDEVDQGQIDD